MAQGIIEIKEFLQSLLNPSVLTFDSAEGVVVIVLCVIIVYRITKNLGDFIGWLIGALFMIQLCYVLGLTVLDDYIPFSAIFKYDLLTAVAQLFNGTFIADIFLYMSAFINYVAKIVTEFFVTVCPFLKNVFGDVFKSLPWEIFVPQ